MHRPTPLGAFCAGVLAGAVGALTQDLFFSLTKQVAPEPDQDAFEPPESEQRNETAPQTVARRTVETLAQHGPLKSKARAGKLVHYAFGAAWGGLYGLVAGTFPRARTALGGAAFGAAVWFVSDDIILPAFRLSAWPHAYSPQVHGYAVAAHLVYGATLSGVYALGEGVAPPLTLLAASHWLTRRWPGPVRPVARRVTRRALRVASRARELRDAVAPA